MSARTGPGTSRSRSSTHGVLRPHHRAVDQQPGLGVEACSISVSGMPISHFWGCRKCLPAPLLGGTVSHAIEFDSAKDAANLAKHGVSLARAADVELTVFVPHVVKGEDRIRAFGLLDDKLHCLVFTMRGENVRAISLRRAKQEEMDDAR